MKKCTSLLTVFLLLHFISNSQGCAVPNSFFPDDTVVLCQGTNYQINAPVVPGATYLWSTAEGTTSINVSFNGKYWLQISDGVCTQTDTVTVLFNSFLLSPPVNDVKLCKGRPAQALSVQGQNVLWYTDPVGGTGSPIAPVPSTVDTGRVTHWVTQTIRGCESPRVPMLVKVIDKPMFELGEAFIIPCDALGITLQVIPDGETNYTWSNGSNESSIVASTRGKYWLYAENMCGNHSDSVVAVECKDKCVQFPTAFTPNSDGKNDIYQAACFCPVSKYKLAIYNRNGEAVFQTTDPKAGWNGYFKGKLQPNGVYIFITEFFDFVLKQTFTEKGTLVLVR
ncbi:MAG: gliding motility-associated C-terminal domain-containing protein [Bacteroidota bacterium]|nr:gliding motility-associated C-terminal domain-containing protein [Bacteroidota bacterium]